MASADPGPAARPTSLREAPSTTSPPNIPPSNKRVTSASAITVRLTLAINPWGTLYINGKRKGRSPPLKELVLEPGRYTLEIRNDKFRPYRESIDLRRSTKAKI